MIQVWYNSLASDRWEEIYDEQTGKSYFYNDDTNEAFPDLEVVARRLVVKKEINHLFLTITLKNRCLIYLIQFDNKTIVGFGLLGF